MDDLPIDDIKTKIHTIRGQHVMLDSDLAELYGVTTKRLNEQVKRNAERFPSEFMFRLTADESAEILRSHFATSSYGWGGRRTLPFAFTDQGVAMLSTVLKSQQAIETSITIIKAFISMKRFLSRNAEVFSRLDKVERKQLEHDQQFERVFQAIEDHQITPNKGIFFDGQFYDAHAFAVDLITSATQSIILIDNFIDESVLTLLSNRRNKIPITIYTRHISQKLTLAQNKFNEQYGNLNIKTFQRSHDRFLIIDDATYHLGASLKDLGKRWFAFSRFNHLDIRSRLP